MYRHFFKRLIDIVSALILLPLVLLVIFIMTFIIRIDDNGPVFYNAKRMGRNGKPFKMFKLRSMKVNAPDLRNADASTCNSDHDPRVTRTGRFMRKTSIDEIPQILNVLKGDMSFIGPRPVLANKPYTEYDEIRRKRLTVRPGITGYSQAFFRNSITQDEKFQYDCYYVDHLTFRLDVKILFVTVYSVLRRKNINTEHS